MEHPEKGIVKGTIFHRNYWFSREFQKMLRLHWIVLISPDPFSDLAEMFARAQLVQSGWKLMLDTPHQIPGDHCQKILWYRGEHPKKFWSPPSTNSCVGWTCFIWLIHVSVIIILVIHTSSLLLQKYPDNPDLCQHQAPSVWFQPKWFWRCWLTLSKKFTERKDNKQLINNLLEALPAYLPWMSESNMSFADNCEPTVAQGIDLMQVSGLNNPSGH